MGVPSYVVAGAMASDDPFVLNADRTNSTRNTLLRQQAYKLRAFRQPPRPMPHGVWKNSRKHGRSSVQTVKDLL